MDDLSLGEPAALHLWSFRLGQSLPQTGLDAGGNVYPVKNGGITAAAVVKVNSRIQRSNSLSVRSRSRHPQHLLAADGFRCAPRVTAAFLSTWLHFRFEISNLQFHGHDPVFVCANPASGRSFRSPFKADPQASARNASRALQVIESAIFSRRTVRNRRTGSSSLAGRYAGRTARPDPRRRGRASTRPCATWRRDQKVSEIAPI